MNTNILVVDLTLTDEQQIELKELAKIDAAEEKINAKYPRRRKSKGRAEERRKEMLNEAELALLTARLAGRDAIVTAERNSARDYFSLRLHVQALLQQQCDAVVKEQEAALLRMAKGEQLDLLTLLMQVSPWGVHALIAGIAPIVNILVAPAKSADNPLRPMDFDLEYRLSGVSSEMEELRRRIAELQPQDPDDIYEDPLFLQGLENAKLRASS